MNNKIDHLLTLFTKDDKLRPSFKTPVTDGDYVVATNAVVLIVAPVNICGRKYEAITDIYPAYKKVIPQHDKSKVLFTTDAEYVYNEAMMLIHEDQYTKCERCDGKGLLYTHKGNSKPCDECEDGTDEFIGNRIPTPSDDDEPGDKTFLFILNGIPFDANCLEAVAKVARVVQQPMNWVRLEHRSAAIVYVGEIMILVMPTLWYQDHNAKHHKGEITMIDIPVTAVIQTDKKQ